MKKIEANDTEAQSAHIVADNLSQLKALFPEAFAEGKVQFETLRQLLGGTVDESDEKYGLNWHGKRRARQIALTPSTGTLRPCPEESVEWDTTQNLMIEGDNLEVLKLLQKSYAGKVKLIYIDPPYNTGKDFVYPDNFRDSIGNYLELTGQVEGGAKISANTDASGRFHTDWLNMIYPRLRLARTLLKSDGLIFVSCDDNEANSLRTVLNEIFGEENFLSQLVWKKSYGGGAKTKHVVVLHEYIFCYAKQKELVGRIELPPDPKARKYYKFKDAKFEIRGPYRLQPLATNSNDERANLRYPIPYQGTEIWPEKQWQWEKSRTFAALENDDLFIAQQDGKWSVSYKQYLRDEDGVERGAKPFSILDGPYTQTGTAEVESLFGDSKVFPFPKPTGLLSSLIQYLHPAKDFIALDFFAGSGGLGDALMRLNAEDGGSRRFILVQLPELTGRSDYLTIADITKERLRRVSKSIKEEFPISSCDVGFRIFKLDKSNIQDWSPNINNLAQTLLDHYEHIIEGRTEADIVYELLLKLGLDLCVRLESRAVASKTVRAVGGGVLMLCLAEKIATEEVEPLAAGIVAWHSELAPAGDSTVVFRDSAFTDDVAKTNMAAILAQHGLGNVRSL